MNIRGNKHGDHKSKFPQLATLLRTEKIAILAIQESRLTSTKTEVLNSQNKNLFIVNSGETSNKEGVAFIINKQILKTATFVKTELIPGRALHLRLIWDEKQYIDFINVYIPNQPVEQLPFLKNLKKIIKENQKNPETRWDNPILLGDFNISISEEDRLPKRDDDPRVVTALYKIIKSLKVVDGWRAFNEDALKFTHIQKNADGTMSFSRIDRIYTSEALYPSSFEWSIVNSAHISDHSMVTCSILKKHAPYTGYGFWKLYKGTMNDGRFEKETQTILKDVQGKIDAFRSEPNPDRTKGNPQKFWSEGKLQIQRLGQRLAKEKL
ncbi:DNase I-like protein, partial [Neolentinus lepideus HHB14362 ss-1]